MIAMGLSACDFSVGKKSAQRGVVGKHTALHLKIAHRAAQGPETIRKDRRTERLSFCFVWGYFFRLSTPRMKPISSPPPPKMTAAMVKAITVLTPGTFRRSRGKSTRLHS